MLRGHKEIVTRRLALDFDRPPRGAVHVAVNIDDRGAAEERARVVPPAKRYRRSEARNDKGWHPHFRERRPGGRLVRGAAYLDVDAAAVRTRTRPHHARAPGGGAGHDLVRR